MINYHLEKPTYFKQLESLRGIAAVLVVFFHCDYFFYPVKHIMLFNKGYLFVDLFFVLSGFVIYINYYNKLTSLRNLKFFLILRLGRIYPLHALTTLIFLLVPVIEFITNDFGISKAQFSISNTIANFFLIQTWGFKEFYSLNTVSWSISTEFFAYVFFAFILTYFRKYSMIIYFIIFAIASMLLLDMDYKRDYFAALTRCLYSFSLGVLACHIFLKYKTESLLKIIPKPVLAVFILFVFVELILRSWDTFEFLIFPFLSAMLILSLIIYPKDKITIKLKSPSLLRIGSLSYSIYMLHGLVITFYLRLFRFFGINYLKLELINIVYSIVLMTIIFISLYALSDFVYNSYEKVIRDKVRKFIQK